MNTVTGSDGFSSLFAFLPIGAYRSSPDGRQLRANPALVRLNGWASEAEQIGQVQDIAREWYVDPTRRATFKALLERDGLVIGFESEVYRHKTRERIWVSENAHLVHDEQGQVLYYEGTVEDITARVREREALRTDRQHLQQIIDMVPGVLYRLIVGPDGQQRLDYISPNVERLLGVPMGEVLADPLVLRRLRHPEDRDSAQAEIAACQAAGRPLDLEFRVLLPDGRLRWIQQTNTTAPSADGCTVRVGLLLDITDRKRAEQALRENSALWKRALESTGDGMWDWDLLTGEERLSPACLALYGYAAGELPGGGPEVLDGLTHPDDRAPMWQDRAEHLAGRSSAYINEHRVRCRDGQYKWVLSRGVVISRAPDGSPLRMIGTHTDITARKQAQALRFERDRAAAADLAKSQFLSRVSHELRTPLNAVLGFAQLLERDPGDGERQRGWIQQVLCSGRHLLALMDDILDLSSLQTAQMPLQLQPVPLHEVVQQVGTMLAAAAQQAGVAVLDGLPADRPLLALADRRRLTQVVSNLLSNGIKYNRPGGWVRLQARREGDTVELMVADSGPGIAPDLQARLFNPFERLGAQQGPVAGTGLGLALSREMAQAMGGSLGLHSEPGQGSTFYLRLPAG